MKFIILLIMLALSGCHQSLAVKTAPEPPKTKQLTPGTVVSASLPEEWRQIDPENTLQMTLETGVVVIELVPELAPLHVENTKQLVRQGIFDGTNFYRVLDAFVAQGGPMYATDAEKPELTAGSFNVPAEFTWNGDLGSAYTAFDENDGYADQTGFLKSYAVGKDLTSNETWLLHCYGAFAMGRANEADSGGTELYIINGPAQRYLDRNTTVFGRVVSGMQHIQALHRSSGLNGPVDMSGKNTIKNIKVSADLPVSQRTAIEVLDSQSKSFKQLLESRKNRTGEWFVYQHDYMDACGVPIPMRLKSSTD